MADPKFYRHFDNHAGLVYDGTHHMFGSPMNGYDTSTYVEIAGSIYWILGLTSASENRSKVYAWAADHNGNFAWIWLSTDAGTTWTQKSRFPGRTGQGPQGSIAAAAIPGNKTFVADMSDNALTSRHNGVWASSDDGATWSRILDTFGTETVYFTSSPSSGSNNVTVSEVMTGPGVGPAIYGIMASPVATDLEFRYICSTDASNWTVRLLDTAGTTVIHTYPLGTGTTGTFHATDIVTWFTAGARNFGFSYSGGGSDTLQGPASTYKGIPNSAVGPRGCGSLAMGASKLWFCWQVSGAHYSNPYPPVQITSNPSALYRIEQCNPDGTGRTTIGEITAYATSTYSSIHDGRILALRPYGDSFCLVPSPDFPFAPPPTVTAGIGQLYKVSSGGVTAFTTPDGPPVDVVALDANTWILLIRIVASNTSKIYKTYNAGSSWSLKNTMVDPAGVNRSAQGGGYQIAVCGPDIYVCGGQGTGNSSPTPLKTWYSGDQGETWSSISYASQPTYNDGYFQIGHLIGICEGVGAVATHVRSFVSII